MAAMSSLHAARYDRKAYTKSELPAAYATYGGR